MMHALSLAFVLQAWFLVFGNSRTDAERSTRDKGDLSVRRTRSESDVREYDALRGKRQVAA